MSGLLGLELPQRRTPSPCSQHRGSQWGKGDGSTRWVQRMRRSDETCTKKSINLWLDEKKSCRSSPGQADSASSSTFIFLRTMKIETLPPLECWRPGTERSRLCVKCWDHVGHAPAYPACPLFSLKDSRLLFTTHPSPLSQMFCTRVEAQFLKVY